MSLANAADETEDRNDVASVDPNEGRVQEKPQLEVDLTDDGDDDGPVEATPEKESRRDRRRRKVSELGAELRTEREQRTRLERELAELKGRVSGLQTGFQALPRQQAEPADPLQREIDGIEAQQDAILVQLRNGQMSEEQATNLAKQHRSLERERRKLEMRQFSQESGGGAPDRSEYENQMLAAEFPEIFNDPIKLGEAKVELMRLNRTRGLPINYATAKLAAKAVADKYTRRSSPPSDADKAKLAAESGRAGAAGSSSRFAPNKMQLSAARAFTSHMEGLSDEQRVKIWAQKVGKPRGLI